MPKHTLKVTIDGRAFYRTTHHEYTHVVAGRPPDRESRFPLQWSKSATNAEKGLRTYRGYGYIDLSIVPVDVAVAAAD